MTPLHFTELEATNPPTGKPFVIYHAGSGVSSFSDWRGMPTDGGPNCIHAQPTIANNDEAAIVEGTRLMLHETGHSLGFAHEQQRRDRDSFVFFDETCLSDNILDGGLPKIEDIDHSSLFLTPFDYESVMLYSSFNSWNDGPGCHNGAGQNLHPVLSKNTGSCAGLNYSLPVPSACIIPTPKVVSVHDVNALNRMYEKPLGVNNANDALGAAIAVGDFDSDGFDDVAVGAPGNQRVYLFKGTAGKKTGLLGRLVAWKVLKADDMTSTFPFSTGGFGSSLAAGDFDGDGHTDLAVGAPLPSGGGKQDGSVALYMSRAPFDPESPRRVLVFAKVVNQSSLFGAIGESDDHFGGALAAVDFDADGKDDLAIGIPRKRVGAGVAHGGEVVVDDIAHGTSTVLTPDMIAPATNVEGARFGAALFAANLDPDIGPRIDLVIGSPETATATTKSGAVYLFRSSPTGIVGKQILRPSTTTAAHFGASLSVGHSFETFTPNGRPAPIVTIGAPYESVVAFVGDSTFVTYPEAGVVHAFQPNGSGSFDYSEAGLVPDSPPASGAHFGTALSGYLSAGAKHDSVLASAPDVGAGHVAKIFWTGPAAEGLSITTIAAPAGSAPGDRFGATVATGMLLPNTAGFGAIEPIVGAPHFGSVTGAGALWTEDAGSAWHRFEQNTANPE